MPEEIPYPDSFMHRRHNLYETAGVMTQVLQRLGMEPPFRDPPVTRDVPIFNRDEFVDPYDAETATETDARPISEQQVAATHMLVIADDERRAQYDQQLIAALDAETTLRRMRTMSREDPVPAGHFRVVGNERPPELRLRCGTPEDAPQVQQCLRRTGFEGMETRQGEHGTFVALPATQETIAELEAMELLTPRESTAFRQKIDRQRRA